MHLDFNPDNLDRYFKNQLPDAERQALEEQIAQDPLLKSEINFQQGVVEAICQRRKWELKDRLNALTPETSPLFTLPRIAFGTTLTLAGLLTATLFWFDNKKTAQAPQKQPVVAPIAQRTEKKAEPQANYTLPTTNQNSHIAQQKAIAPTVAEITLVAATPHKIETFEKARVNVVCPPQQELVAEDNQMPEYLDESLLFEVANTDTDNGAFDRNSEDEHSLDRAAARQRLRYQYYSGQLSLYNNTSPGKQIHTAIDGKVRHFLYYEGVFYEFFDNQISETIMQPLRDKQAFKIVKEAVMQLEAMR